MGLFALQASYGLAYAFGQQDNLGQAFFALRTTSKQIDNSLADLHAFTETAQQGIFFDQYNQQWPASLSDLKLGFFAPTLKFDAKYLLDTRSQAQSIKDDISRKQTRLIQLETMLAERSQTYVKRQQNLSLSSAQERLIKAQQSIDAMQKLLSQSSDFDSQLDLSKQMADASITTHVTRVEMANARLTRLKADTTPKRPLKTSYEERLKRVRGILHWQLMDGYVAQQWQHQKSLQQAQNALDTAHAQYENLQGIAKQEDAFSVHKATLSDLKTALTLQSDYADSLHEKATHALTQRLLTLIDERQTQLKLQGVNTRLAMLRIQDLQQEDK